MRLGRVFVRLFYVVDLDNPGMMAHAKECLFEDINQIAHDSDEFNLAVDQEDAPDATSDDICELFREADRETSEEAT